MTQPLTDLVKPLQQLTGQLKTVFQEAMAHCNKNLAVAEESGGGDREDDYQSGGAPGANEALPVMEVEALGPRGQPSGFKAPVHVGDTPRALWKSGGAASRTNGSDQEPCGLALKFPEHLGRVWGRPQGESARSKGPGRGHWTHGRLAENTEALQHTKDAIATLSENLQALRETVMRGMPPYNTPPMPSTAHSSSDAGVPVRLDEAIRQAKPLVDPNLLLLRILEQMAGAHDTWWTPVSLWPFLYLNLLCCYLGVLGLLSVNCRQALRVAISKARFN